MRFLWILLACSLLSSCWWSLDPNTTPIGDGPTLPPQRVPCDVLPYALPVPEQEGYVFSPYHNKVVDCKGLKRGTKVFDPYDTTEPRRTFLVP